MSRISKLDLSPHGPVPHLLWVLTDIIAFIFSREAKIAVILSFVPQAFSQIIASVLRALVILASREKIKAIMSVRTHNKWGTGPCGERSSFEILDTDFGLYCTKSIESVRRIVAKCGSFLTVQDNQIYLIYQSAKDFLLDRRTQRFPQDAFSWVFREGTEDVHHNIFLRSLNAISIGLRRDMYDLRAPGIPIDKVQTPSPDPLATLRYSCVFWVDHLRDSISNTDMP